MRAAKREAENPDGQGDGESLDGAAGDHEEDHRGDQGGDIGIEDRGKGLVVGGLDGGPQGFSGLHFLAESLVDEDVGVDGDPDGEDDSGDPRMVRVSWNRARAPKRRITFTANPIRAMIPAKR